MKKTSIILTLAVLFTGCIERSHLDDNQYDPSVYLTHWGLVKTDTFYDVSRSYSAPLYVYCAGYKAADATVRLEYDETLTDLYNADNGTAYRPLPSDCYTIGNDEVSTVNRKGSFNIVFDCDALKALSTEANYSDLEEYVVPFKIKSLTEGVTEKLHEEQSQVLLVPDMKKLSLVFNEAGTSELKYADVVEDAENIYLSYQVYTSVDDNKWDCDVTLHFNEATPGLPYPQLPDGSWELSNAEEKLMDGVSEINWMVVIRKSLIPDPFYSIVARVETDGSFEVLGESVSVYNYQNRKVLSKSALSVTFCDSWQSSTYAASKIIDDNKDTMWHCAFSSSHNGVTSLPYQIILKVNREIYASSFILTRRGDKYVSDLRGGSIYGSVDGSDWKLISNFDFGDSSNTKRELTVSGTEVKSSYLKLVFTTSNRNNIASLSELDVLYR